MSDAELNGNRKSKIENRKSRNWVWFFIALAVMGAAAIAVNWIYNYRQQLTREQLDAARRLWKEKRPADYDLEYSKHGSAAGTFRIRVRDGKVTSLTLDNRPVTRNDRPISPKDYADYDMSG